MIGEAFVNGTLLLIMSGSALSKQTVVRRKAVDFWSKELTRRCGCFRRQPCCLLLTGLANSSAHDKKCIDFDGGML